MRAHIFENKLIKSVANLLHVGVRLDNNISLHKIIILIPSNQQAEFMDIYCTTDWGKVFHG